MIYLLVPKKRNHSRFDIDLTNTTKTINIFERKCDFPEKYIKCKTIEILPTEHQKEILKLWF